MNKSKWELPTGWNPIHKKWMGDDNTKVNLLYPDGTIHYEQFSYDKFLVTCQSKYDDSVRDAIGWQYAEPLEIKNRFYIIPSDDQWYSDSFEPVPSEVDVIDRDTGNPVTLLNGLYCGSLRHSVGQQLEFVLNYLENERIQREAENAV